MITDLKDFPGFKFTQEHVAKALRYGPTTLTEDRKLFKPDSLHLFPEVSDWLDDPNGKYDLKFGSMTLKVLRQYLDETRARSENNQMKKGKKNTWVMSEDEEQLISDSMACIIRKGKAHCIDSDELDG